MTNIFVNRPFLFKIVCFIEVSSKFMQEKTVELIFPMYAVHVVCLN